MKLSASLALRCILLRVEGLKAFLHAGIVDTQELVLCGGHVDKVRFPFGTLLVEELIYWLVCRRLFQVGADNLIQRLAQMR